LSLILLLAAASCSTVSVPQPVGKIERRVIVKQEVEQIVAGPPAAADARKAEYAPIPSQPVEMPQAGDTLPLGVKVTEELSFAFNSYLGGDGEKALSRLDELDRRTADPAVRWQSSFLRAQILLMMGRGAAAEEELENTARREAAHFGSDLNALALKGEVKIWLEDYDGALLDFAGIMQEIGTWELPIQFRSFPSNRVSLYYLTTAKLRAYTGIAAVHIFREDYRKALAWAKEAARLYNHAHFVVNHPLYGMGDEIHADAYYGRAMNLTFLATATLAVTGDIDAAEELYRKAIGFYEAIGYTVGRITVAALKARGFNRLGMHDRCYGAGLEAIQLAVAHDLPDYVWRIGVLSGITLYSKGLEAEAEKMFRQAQNAVETISGSLATDRAKTRFGVGKQDIIYHLAEIDIRRRDWPALFSDLERARARSFVDLMGDQALSSGRESALVSEIRELEARLRKQRLLNMAPGLPDPAGISAARRLQLERTDKIAILRQRDPEMADLLSVGHAGLQEVQADLAAGEAICYAIPGRAEDPLRFFVITPDRAFIHSLEITHGNVGQLVDRFAAAFELETEIRGIELIRKKRLGKEPDSPETAIRDLKSAFNLSGLPVRKALYLVPSGALYFVPWGALETPYPVVLLPTGSWLTRSAQAVGKQREIVIVGDPEFGGKLPQLPGARKEAAAVGEIYREQPLLGKEASEANLRSRLGDGAGILHLATHGIFDAARPLQSAVFLSANDTAHPLTAGRIFENPLPARLVILSACETGLGRSVAGDDLLGLTRSFYLGGAVATLSSLWQIDDEGTMAFMRKFHELAVQGDYGKAWVSARDHAAALGYAADVYAAFTLGGALR